VPLSRFLAWLRRDRPEHVGMPRQLQRCPECGTDFVYPITWTESGPADWWLLLRCGQCGVRRDVVASNLVVAEFDRVLDEELERIRCEADRLERESLRAQADSFGTALRLDLLTADDFRLS
jgi:hypothetical protein